MPNFQSSNPIAKRVATRLCKAQSGRYMPPGEVRAEPASNSLHKVEQDFHPKVHKRGSLVAKVLDLCAEADAQDFEDIVIGLAQIAHTTAKPGMGGEEDWGKIASSLDAAAEACRNRYGN